MLIRLALGRPGWSSGPVLTAAIFVAVIVWLVSVGVFGYWARWAKDDRSLEEVARGCPGSGGRPFNPGDKDEPQ